MAAGASGQSAPSQQVLLLDPSLILVDDNVRYGLKRHAIDSLKADILEHNGIHTPGEVERLEAPQNGKQYRLTVGAYRHTALTELNEQDKAGLLFPAIVKSAGSPVDRLRRQLSENLERESMSPLDMAIAIQKLLDAGVSKSDVRTIFARPRPGVKDKMELQPASNSWVNMTLSFLELPKNIQEKIHLGIVGVGAAYELTKVSPERQVAVLERVEAEQERERKREEGDETKFIAAEKKLSEAKDKAAAEEMLLNVTKDALKLAEDDLKAKVRAAADAYVTVQSLPKDTAAEEKKIAEELYVAAETDVKGVKNLIQAKKKAVEKLETKVSGVVSQADQLKERLENARKAKGATSGKKKAGKGGVSAREVKKAAKEEGEGNHVPLTLVQVRQVLAKMANSRYPTVKKVGEVLTACCDGIPTDNEAIDKIAVFVGDKIAPKVKPQPK